MTPSKQSAVSAASGAGKPYSLLESTSHILTTPGNAATSNGGVGLHSLPNEIVDTICACLTFKSLKKFRLVSQKYEPPTKKYLYQTFVLWRTNTSWQKLGSIAETPELAVLVKCIQVARVSPLCFFSDKLDWASHNIGSSHRRKTRNTG